MPDKPPIPSGQRESIEALRQPAPAESGAITARAIILGTILCVILSLAVPFNMTIIRGTDFAFDHNAPGAIALFFILVAGVNLLLRSLARWAGDSSFLRNLPLTVPELLTVYVMLVVSSCLCTMGLGVQLPPIIAAPHYFEIEGRTYAQALAQHGGTIPGWLTLTDKEAIRGFYEGLAVGEDFWPRFMEIFLGHWLRPLAFWAILLFAVYGAMVCIVVIFRKQWMDREILIYPLTKVPLAMVEPDPQGRLLNPLFRNKLMWLGFVVPAFLCSLQALTKYVPGFTVAHVGDGALSWNAKFLEGLLTLYFRISLPAVAFAFLVNLEVSFSIWSFGLLGIVVVAILTRFGLNFDAPTGGYGANTSALLYYMGAGAVAAMVAYSLWISRSHLRDVLAKAFGRGRGVDDSGELLSYRSAVFGLLICSAVILIWLVRSGMSIWLAIVFLALAFAIFYALSRVVAEAGVATVVAPNIAPNSSVLMFGGPAVGVGGLISLALSYVWAADLRTFVMAPIANGLKVIEGVRKKRRRLVWAIFLAIAVTFVLAPSMVIYQSYRTGGININSWFFVDAAKMPYGYIHTVLSQTWTTDTSKGWLLGGAGAGLMLALLLMRRQFAWWPLHPIGLIILGTWMMPYIWFSFCLAWMTKLILLKYGGPRLYAKAVPFFLGLILGQFSICAVWAVIDYCSGVTGNRLFWM